MMSVRKIVAMSLMSLAVIACVPSDNFAPVADVSGYEAVPASGAYHVSASDTLYSIAWRYGQDYRVLAKNNHIEAPFSIHTGQVIYLRGRAPVAASAKPVIANKPSEPAAPIVDQTPSPIVKVPPFRNPVRVVRQQPVANESKEPNYHVSAWVWPAHGKLLALYSNRNKGIDIGGSLGAPVYAAAPGKVVYAGDGLRGYGNLIILKHNSQLLSAYAYNKRLFVREGEWVKKGQIIAGMGRSQSGAVSLHFEIRKAGLPVNPLNLISK